MTKFNIGICAKIYRVLTKFHIYFIESPRKRDSMMLVTIPDIRVVSIKEKVAAMPCIKSKNLASYNNYSNSQLMGVKEIKDRNHLW